VKVKAGDMPRIHTRSYPVVETVELDGVAVTIKPYVPSRKAVCDCCSERVCWVPNQDLDDLPPGEAIRVVCMPCRESGRATWRFA
jgi:hypothetical protein